MKLKEKEIYRLIGEVAEGNISRFCRMIDVERSGFWYVLNGKRGGGNGFIPAFFDYCKKNKLNFMTYFD